MPDYLTEPEWLALIVAIVALIPQIIKLARRMWKRWNDRFMPRNTQVHKDRANYNLLLQKYEGYLVILENLIVLRYQVQRGPDPFTPELKQQFVQTRDGVYDNLEKRSKREKEMGVFQMLEVLEDRMVGMADLRNKRA